MVCLGSKTINSRLSKTINIVEDNQMAGDDNLSVWDGKKRNKNRKPAKEHQGYHGDHPTQNPSGRSNKVAKSQTSSRHQNDSNPETTVLRKQVDPELAKYFTEIANVIEGTGVDYEERSAICGNALEEAKGKELELATDYILSHTLQALLGSCDLDHLCDFLQNCAEEFPSIAIDRSGSHVAETALRSLTMHLQDENALSVIQDTLTKICQVIVVKPVDVMCNPHGSHVLRSLLCICKGIPLEFSEEFHVTKSATTLAERLNTKVPSRLDNLPHAQHSFPDLLKLLVKKMLKCGRKDIETLRVDQYSSLVFQAALKLLVGEDQELMHIIPVLLGCNEDTIREGNLIESTAVHDIVKLLKDNAFSHLMEVILEVAPETLYDEIFAKIFRNSLFKISSDHCGSFVIQALVSSVRSQDQMDLIWEELGGKFKELIELGKSGVIASLLATSQRLHTHERKCCQALADTVSSKNESPTSIVPRILFLDNYIWSEDKSTWKWPKGDRLHILGCLMLQTIFKYPSEFIQSYVTSLLAMEPENLLETAKNSGGGRVIEAFLSSGVAAKQKRRLIAKLRSHYGELSMHPSGSFTVEKCFTASNASLKETIASELLAVKAELSKTKQGPYLSRKLDIDGFASRPEQWRLRLDSKQNAYNEYHDTFGSGKSEPSKGKRGRSEPFVPGSGKGVKHMKKEIDEFLDSTMKASEFGGIEASMKKLGFAGQKRQREGLEEEGSKKMANFGEDESSRRKKKEKRKKRKDVEA